MPAYEAAGPRPVWSSPELSDALRRLGEYVVDQHFRCAVVIFGPPQHQKSVFAAHLAWITGAALLGGEVLAAGPAASYRDCARIAAGLNIARQRPVVINTPGFGCVRAAECEKRRLREHLCRHASPDIAVATTWFCAGSDVAGHSYNRSRDLADLVIGS